jgi:hypothetical protein
MTLSTHMDSMVNNYLIPYTFMGSVNTANSTAITLGNSAHQQNLW